MSDNEVAIAIVAIVFGTALGIVVVVKLFGLIKAWINRNNNSYDEEKFNRLAKAFIQHKKDTNRRLETLEADTGHEKTETADAQSKIPGDKRSHKSIEIEENDTSPPQKESDSGRLRNMLNK